MIDTETTGLEPENGLLLEVGIMVVDADTLEVQDVFSRMIWDNGYSKHLTLMRDSDTPGDKYVCEMHDKSGLWKAASLEGIPLLEAEADLLKFMDEYGITTERPIKERDAMMGSSIQFDRQWLDYWMQPVTERFSYRNIDISTIVQLCMRRNPRVYSKAPQKQEVHRVEPDLFDSLAEYKFYDDNFLFCEPGF